jgi:hypothetical protein
MSANEIVLRIIGVLNELGIPYMMVGSYSSNYWGRPRLTKDVDFVIALEGFELNQLTAALGPDFRTEQQMSFETVTMHTRHKIVHRQSLFQIEFFELTKDPFNQSRFNRRRQIEFRGLQTWLPSPEDVIVQKLMWASRNPNREQDILDAREVIGVQKKIGLDLEYIRHWTDQHGTRDLFDKLLGQ